MAHIPGTINIDYELTISTPETKLIALLDMDKFHKARENGKDVLRKIYPSARQYLAFPDTI